MLVMIERRAVRNVLVCAGAYHLSKWLALPLDILWGKLTSGHIYRGDFAGVVLLPLVEHLPLAFVAFGAGIAVVWLVESDRSLLWLIFPAALYGCLGLLGYHWGRPPQFLDSSVSGNRRPLSRLHMFHRGSNCCAVDSRPGP